LYILAGDVPADFGAFQLFLLVYIRTFPDKDVESTRCCLNDNFIAIGLVIEIKRIKLIIINPTSGVFHLALARDKRHVILMSCFAVF